MKFTSFNISFKGIILSLSLISSFALAQVERIGNEKIPHSLHHFLYQEQVLHNKNLWPRNSFKTNVDAIFYPEKRPKFPLPYYLLEQGDAELIQAHPLSVDLLKQLIVKKAEKTYFKLFVHPESQRHYRFLKDLGVPYISAEETEFFASPTSSFRTLLVWNPLHGENPPFMAKVSLDKKIIGGIDRLVSENEIRRSIGNQRAFNQIGAEALEKAHLDIFPEPAGLLLPLSHLSKKHSLKKRPEKLGGQIIREIPDKILNGKNHWISFASLMSPKRIGKPLIMEIIKKTDLPTQDFIRQYLIDSFISMIENVEYQKGMTLEPHAQNLLFETDADLNPTNRWVIRDFGGIWPDGLTMIENNGPLSAYADGPFESYKFPEGRGNQISSVINFYKRQIFDFILVEIQKHDSSLTQDLIDQLSKEFQEKHLSLINKYLHLKETELPNMKNYEKIIKKLTGAPFIRESEVSLHHVWPSESWARDFIWEKIEKQRFVNYVKFPLKKENLGKENSLEIHSVPSALYLKYKGLIVGFVPLTLEEQQLLQDNLDKIKKVSSEIEVHQCK